MQCFIGTSGRKLRKLSILYNMIVLLIVMGTTVFAKDASDYTDVHSYDWFYQPVAEVSKSGFMTGISETVFAPAQNLERGQLSTILYRMAGSPDTGYCYIFPDVADGIFYSIPITWAYNAGVIMGYDDKTFGPGDKITREQLATMLYRYAGKFGYDTSARGNIYKYPDGSSVSEFAKEAVSWAIGEGIITGDNNNINPLGDVSRAVCATMISRLDFVDDSDGEPSDEESPKARYSYDVRILNNPDYTMYDGSTVFIYIKTNNPDAESIDVKINQSDDFIWDNSFYSDISYLDEILVYGLPLRVKGGYLCAVMPLSPGNMEIDIAENTSSFGRITVWSGQIELKNYSAAEEAWFTSVINEVTNDSMSGTEKMDAVCKYVRNNFIYSPNDGTNLLMFASHEGAFWEVKEIDCIDATRIMRKFADRFGYESRGTYAGYANHHYATVIIDGEEHIYEASQPAATNVITEWEYLI